MIEGPSAKVSIILPTLNEVGNIVLLIEQLEEVVTVDHEIIVVDDNSTDGTIQAVQNYIASHTPTSVTLLVRTENHGLTNSLRDGIKKAKGKIVLWMDCDLSMPAAEVPKLLKCIDDGYDIAVGSRFVAGGSFKRNTGESADSWVAVVLSRMMNWCIRLLLFRNFRDYTSGFIAIKKDVLDRIELRGDYGEYFIDLMVRAILLQYKFIEIPYTCLPRVHGTSKTGQNLFDYMRRGIKYLILATKIFWMKIRYRLFNILD